MCTVESLAEWMKKNKKAVIITDVKKDNLKALHIIKEHLPDYPNRVIPQIYNPENYTTVKKMGFRQVIWTLYKYVSTITQLAQKASTLEGPIAITMPSKPHGKTRLPQLIKEMNMPTYVHTINSEQELRYFQEKGVTEIYTDFLPPENIKMRDTSL